MDKMPSYRVMTEYVFENEIFYRISCDCMNPKDDINVDVEYEDDILTVTLDGIHQIADWWYHPTWIGRIWKRIRMSLQILFTGYMETHGEFLLLEEKHIDSIINLLQDIKDRKHSKGKDAEREDSK